MKRGWGTREILRLALPNVLNMASYTLMQFVDGWMVSKLGKEALAAQLGGWMFSFTALCFFMGLVVCVSTFASQYLGAGKPERAALFGWQGLWLSLLAGMGLLLFIPMAPWVFSLFNHSPVVTRLETQYFVISTLGCGFVLGARALGNYFIGIHHPKVTLIAGIAGNVVNLVANYLLIFGNHGFPQLGVSGAAIGTVIGYSIEFVILLGFFGWGPLAKRFNVRQQCRFDYKTMKELIRIGAPNGCVWLSDFLMWNIFFVGIIGMYGTDHLAAVSILIRYWRVCFLPAIGLSIATAAIVGRYCGAGQKEIAARRTYASLFIVELYMVSAGLIIWLFGDPLVALFNSDGDPAVQKIATSLFVYILICQAFDALSFVFMGALRGAGDTFWPSVIQGLLAWGIGLGGSFLLIQTIPSADVHIPWIAATAYIALLGIAMWIRFAMGNWKQICLTT